ncbi:MAG TPA: glucose-6-phosphate isomerase [Phycisphaerae bacterium]|nr:glucose-6-phosphate isomerase [Phycisphaerae bacterium]
MSTTPTQQWARYKQFLCTCPSIGLSLDISRMNFPDDFFDKMKAPMQKAFTAMDALEAGAIANPDEKRMVGHYWLRDPDRTPNPQLRDEIKTTLASIKQFASDIHTGKIKSESGIPFTELLVIGIGGSALGPQFVRDALTTPHDRMRVHFFDNTDPDGMDRALSAIEDLPETLTVVISKSGGTKETRNGMLAAAAAYKAAGLDFGKHAVAVTGDGSELDKVAVSEGWLKRFPMWDWVGGRTSELSAVGLLPAALQGIDIDALLAGAKDTDFATRMYDTAKNPAALLALMWFYAGNGKGQKDMVVLPYKDRLLLFSRYLQQLVMESLGKEKDLAGNIVHQGIAVYGNKGSTDQHAYVQQLREGVNNFFATFIEVLSDTTPMSQSLGIAIPGQSAALLVEPDVTSGDYLHGFYQGTRTALHSNGRESITITANELTPRTIGTLIALFERAVGLYASLININAYHQPGVEAGKKAATAVITIQKKILAHLRTGKSGTAEEIAQAIGAPDDTETVHLTLRHLAANPTHKILATPADSPLATTYSST